MIISQSSIAGSADASGLIPARLGIEAGVAIVDTGWVLTAPVAQLPYWDEIHVERPPAPEAAPQDLMLLDARHNPLLAELWRGESNDDLVDAEPR